MMYGKAAEQHGQKKSVKAKHQATHTVFAKLLQVNFKAGREHDVQKSHGAEEHDAAVPQQEVETIRAHDGTGQYQSDDMRHFNFVEQDRGKQNDEQHQRKNHHRVA